MEKLSFSDLQKKQTELIQSLATTDDLKALDGLMTNLKKVKEDIGKFQKERAATVGEIAAAIVEYQIKLSELSDAARQVLNHASEATKPVKKAAGTSAPRARRTGAVLIKISTGSRPVEYNQGQSFPAYVPRAFKAMYEADKAQFESVLKGSYTDAGKAYFASPEGSAELKKLVEFVKTKPPQAPAKKK